MNNHGLESGTYRLMSNNGLESGTHWLTYVIIALAVIAGAVLVFWVLRRKGARPAKPWSELADHQVTEDVFDGTALIRWSKQNKEHYQPGMKLLVAKCTKKWVTQLGYEYPDGLDAEHNIIACMVDMADSTVVCPQLFSFGEMSGKMQEQFKGSNTFFLEY